jgi:hypothetical protein
MYPLLTILQYVFILLFITVMAWLIGRVVGLHKLWNDKNDKWKHY